MVELAVRFYRHAKRYYRKPDGSTTSSLSNCRLALRPAQTPVRSDTCGRLHGRVAAVYNYRHKPQGVRVAISDDLTTFDLENEITIFDAATEATLGVPENENFMTQHMLIGFGKPGGILLNDGTIIASFFCTVAGVTHTRWVRLQA